MNSLHLVIMQTCFYSNSVVIRETLKKKKKNLIVIYLSYFLERYYKALEFWLHSQCVIFNMNLWY